MAIRPMTKVHAMARPVGGRLSEVFRSTYEAAGLTQSQLAEALQARGLVNVDQSTISKWSRGMQRVPLEVLPPTEDACGVPLGTILRGAGYVADAAAVSVPEAIATDPALDERGRVVVMETYEFQVRRSVERLGERSARMASPS